MADRKECEVCRKAQAEKHKYDIIWKVVSVVGITLSIIFMCLYFGAKSTVDKLMSDTNSSFSQYIKQNGTPN